MTSKSRHVGPALQILPITKQTELYLIRARLVTLPIGRNFSLDLFGSHTLPATYQQIVLFFSFCCPSNFLFLFFSVNLVFLFFFR